MLRRRKIGVREIVSKVIVALSIVFLGYFIIILLMGPYALLTVIKETGRAIWLDKISLLVFLLFPINVTIPETNVEILFWGITLFYLLVLIKCVLDGKSLKTMFKEESLSISENSFVITLYTTSFVMLIVFIMTFLFEKTGVEVGHLVKPNPVMYFFEVTFAPIKEEIAFRLTFIGPILMVVYLIRENSIDLSVLKGIIYPYKLIRSREELKTLAWILILSSSLLFGVLHYISGTGWKLGKVPTATISGILLGYLYVYHGLPASIFSHWIFNYLVEITLVLSPVFPALVFGIEALIMLGCLTSAYLLVSFLKLKEKTI